MDQVTHTVDIVKIDEDRRLFGGWAYVARDHAGQVAVDHSGDFVDTDDAWEVLKDSSVRFAVDVRAGDDSHETFGVAKLAEFLVWDQEKRDLLGVGGGPDRAIFASFWADRTDDGEALWQKVRSGRLTSLSIVGRGRREDVEKHLPGKHDQSDHMGRSKNDRRKQGRQRRSGIERRGSDRRRRTEKVPVDRRFGQRRSTSDRRVYGVASSGGSRGSALPSPLESIGLPRS